MNDEIVIVNKNNVHEKYTLKKYAMKCLSCEEPFENPELMKDNLDEKTKRTMVIVDHRIETGHTNFVETFFVGQVR